MHPENHPPQLITTYAFAYSDGQVQLCEYCANDYNVIDRFGALGEVLSGPHLGDCESCWADEKENH